MASSATDHLTALPSELLQHIISYLYPTHRRNKALGHDLQQPRLHNLERLAATCHTLRNEVNNWALHFLLEHRAITEADKKIAGHTLAESAKTPTTKVSKKSKSKVGKSTLAQNNLRVTKSIGLLSWSEKHCVFCGKQSARSAIMMNGLKCCKDCDKVEWKDKITKSDAIKEYDLKERHLLPHEHWEVILFEQLGIPRLRFGTYICQGGVTTMFMREDVRRLAEEVHGGLEEHLARREKRKEESKKIRAANKERRAAKKAEQENLEAAQARQKAGQAAVQRAAMDEAPWDVFDHDDGNSKEHSRLIE